jgi:hypothetical protein
MPHAMSLRMSDEVYEEAKSIIRRRGVSFNAFVEETIRKEIAAEREREMFEAASLLGTDPDTDVEFAFGAQAEVALREG